MTSRWICAVAVLALCLGCATKAREGAEAPSSAATESPAGATAARPDWAAPPLERAVSVLDGRTGARLTFDELLDRLAERDAVFLGETHVDETTHRVELAVYEGLLERRRGRVVLGMEMFERDVQEHLDAYLRGETDEATFLAHARPWSNYRSGYRPLIERARAAGAPVVASNFPLPLRRRIAMEGPDVLATLEGPDRALVPARFHPNTKEYWRRVDNAVRGHQGMMPGGGGDDDRLYATQSLWDNSMGDACAKALDEHPGSAVLHVNGGFHSQYWDGTVHQFRLRKPGASVATVSILPTPNPGVADVGGAPWADYVVFAESRATDLNDGTWSVGVQRSVRYRLRLPPDMAPGARAPLLIWLSDDGLTAEDGLDLWAERLGGDVALAVVEAPYRETQEDLGEGGRWFWNDTFSGDVGTMQSALGRIWGYVLRNYPIDPTRVCIAGEGTGGTVVAAVSLLSGMDVAAVSLAPRRFAKIKDFPLPLPEYRGDEPPADKSLRVIAPEADEAWWTGEISAYAEIGFDAAFVRTTADPWDAEQETENALRSALSLPALPPRYTAGARRYVGVSVDTPRARHWARLLALRTSAVEGVAVAAVDAADAPPDAQPVAVAVTPESVRQPGALPPCPGPFGGTTVLVVPPGVAPEPWIALEADDPLAKRNRFLRVRIATLGGERDLAAVLTKLESERRRNVLIVPAVFCADAATMSPLRRAARAFEDRMTLQWLPGLGGAAK